MNLKNMHKDRILIIDFGSQYTVLIARRIRELGVYCELWDWNVTKKQVESFNPNGIILSGGPESSISYNSPRAPDYIFYSDIPILGICYGMQIMTIQLGGQVLTANKREFGHAQVEIIKDSPLIFDLKDTTNINNKTILNVWMSHCDIVTIIPKDFTPIARTNNCPFSIIANEKKRFYGVQFHPEVTQTNQGKKLLKNFVHNICECTALWTPVNILDNIVTSLKKTLGNDKVIIGLSGGIDSTVAALLLHRAIGKHLTCIFIDNGLLRLHEATQVMTMFSSHLGLNVLHIEAEQRFLNALDNIEDPEEKRKIIGRVFIEIFDEEASKLCNIQWLAQGTIYPDIIESAMSNNTTTRMIKSHHNVGGLPKKMKLHLIEPVKTLFKDEIKKIGIELGLPSSIIARHPFPGPGLAIRILGNVKKEYCDLLRYADSIFIEELHHANLYNKISQAFTVFLPIRSVGIMGDERKYDWVIALRAVETIDFMTARWAYLTHDFLAHVSNRIINEIKGISRVVYDISGKPPATIEWE
ncbi:GMP synthase [glutamine-hydrolyzing] [Candidatus Erwinia haradaeae]|uniref:GMP synthase [glutamine-hydrolyzing] n=1 Tax=Candidatus Erwinia haradaeae TaxID=1922217 RepID=A0A451CYM5_9GAMM|nr:glutamine-hydrolyzing GMP synthase [Candidatus Erwinia haradaeae]VFP78505.1 GMP synthase [glutamine-hydrolyzing] [Candidatus Erwinia haradaeae]